MAPAKKLAWPDPPPPPSTRERVFGAIEEMAGDPEVSTTLVGLAAGISARRVKAILADAETTFTAELLKQRMVLARRLLSETNYAISNVAELCGYRCASTFAKRFASQNQDLTPRQYRVAKGGRRRAGATTGAFRKPAQRARAEQEGAPGPGMHRVGMLPGTVQVMLADHENGSRRARLLGEPAPTPRWPVPREPSDPYFEAYVEDYLERYEEEW
jgi:AraC-like DNA-binding protein